MNLEHADSIKIAYIVREERAYSETFIRTLFLNIKCDVTYFWNMGMSSYDGNLCVTKEKSFNHCLKQRFLDERINFVFAHYGLTGVNVLDVCKELKIPLVVHFHGFDAYKYWVIERYKDAYRSMFDYCSAIIAVSNDMVQQLKILGAPVDKIVYAPCGPDKMFFLNDPKFDELNFVSVGRFVNKKAPYITLLAFKEVLKKYPNTKLKMIGDGDVLFETCINLAEIWNMLGSVTFTGSLDHNSIKEILNTAFCFVQHSIIASDGDSEGSPVSVMEASAASLPIIATKHKGLNEIVINYKTGYLVNEKDANEMAAKMIYLVENQNVARKMGENGRKYIRENFSMERYISTIEKVIVNCYKEYQS